MVTISSIRLKPERKNILFRSDLFREDRHTPCVFSQSKGLQAVYAGHLGFQSRQCKSSSYIINFCCDLVANMHKGLVGTKKATSTRWLWQ